jgi:hypothetical protein
MEYSWVFFYTKANKTLQLTQKASFVLCIALRFIIAQNKGHFLVT